MKGKGEVLTYWLTGTTEGAIRARTLDDDNKLNPLFSFPAKPDKLRVGNSVEVSRRRSPRMSMISCDLRQSYRERNQPGTPDSRRMSANARSHHDSGDREQLTGESLTEDYKVFNFDTKDERDKAFAAKLLAGRGKSPGQSLSLRAGTHSGSSYTINSSQNSAAYRLD